MLWFCPLCTEAAVGFTAIAIAGGTTVLDIVIVATAVLDVSATGEAVNVIAPGEGTFAGAVYVIAAPEALEVADRMPQVVPLQPAPFNVQLTPLFCASFCTVALKACVCPAWTDAAGGVTATAIAGGGAALVSVIVATAVLELSATDVAVAVTDAGEGTFAGAVYVIAAPEALEVADRLPQAAPLQPTPESAQITPLF
jgi:hypothetical protein